MQVHVIDGLTTWREVHDCLDIFAGDWIFRGQREASWGLASTLDRSTSRLPKQMAEHLVYRDFTRNMHAYIDSGTAPTNLLEVFSIMQHHGAPTRLLDFTHSAYVACFFAVENATDESSNCAVWAIDESWCKHNGAEIVRTQLGYSDPELKSFKMKAATLEDKHFKKIFYDAKLQLILPVEPYGRNERLTIQQGLFLCPGDVNK
jgi:hypothetical protein